MNFQKTTLSVVVTSLLFLLLFLGGPDYYSPRSIREAWDLGHLIFFALFTFTLLNFWKKKNRWVDWNFFLIVILIVVVLGALTEFLQGIFGRDVEWMDLRRDVVGGLFALALFNPIDTKKSLIFKKIFKVIVIIIVFIETLPLAFAVTDEIIAWKQFPILSSFETPLEANRWEATNGKTIATDIVHSGEKSFKALLDTIKYSGVALKHFPSDWREYRTLKFNIYNTDTFKILLHCRIHDQQHIGNGQPYSDRFNTILKLNPGWNQFAISLDKVQNAPKTRQMDLSQIKSLAFFVLDLPHPIFIYLDDVYLE